MFLHEAISRTIEQFHIIIKFSYLAVLTKDAEIVLEIRVLSKIIESLIETETYNLTVYCVLFFTILPDLAK